MSHWTALHRPERMKGHKIHRDEQGRISLCDWSGSTPDRTDDGPLIVEPRTIVTACVCRYANTVAFDVPVHCTRTGEPGLVRVNADTMRALVHLVFLKVDRSPEFKRLHQDVEFAAGLSPAFE